MKPLVTLWVAVISLCVPQAHADTMVDGPQSYALGVLDAAEGHRSWPWFFAGVGSCLAAAAAYGMVDSVLLDASGRDAAGPPGPMPALAFGLVLGAPFVPAVLVHPRRTSVHTTREGVDLERYRDGYLWKARRKNAVSLALGEAAPIAGLLVLVLGMAAFGFW